jgi:NADPH:quinone reductase-like Zn-dependent oxidoreductase
MRLIRLKATGGLENLELVEEDRPQPGRGELLVRVRAYRLERLGGARPGKAW